MERITIEPFGPAALQQNRIRLWGVPCGYCGTQAGRPVCFYAGRMDRLTIEEKADVIEYVTEHVGPVKCTPQTKAIFDVIDDRRNSQSKRPNDNESPMP